MAAFNGAGNREVPLSPNELADRLANTETVSPKNTGCDQMQCKGLLLQGEIILSEGDEEHQSWVTDLCSPAQGDTQRAAQTRWAQICQIIVPGLTQAFADFLVACERDKDVFLTQGLRQQAALHSAQIAWGLSSCSWDVHPLLHRRGRGKVQASTQKKGRRGKGKVKETARGMGQGKGKRKGMGRQKGTARAEDGEEEEVEDSSTDDEEDKAGRGWGGSDTERSNDPLADEDCQPSKKYQQVMALGQVATGGWKRVAGSLNKPAADQAPKPTHPQLKPTYCGSKNDRKEVPPVRQDAGHKDVPLPFTNKDLNHVLPSDLVPNNVLPAAQDTTAKGLPPTLGMPMSMEMLAASQDLSSLLPSGQDTGAKSTLSAICTPMGVDAPPTGKDPQNSLPAMRTL
ncbi:hypothetical protein B0H14DRAFT_2594726 [Mycena olivaceomarginata]|nr:hypothetical protein B0H14DRAFT_2594726 [Mycena olivaceomarginata]